MVYFFISPPFPLENNVNEHPCFFCDRSQFEERIIYENDKFYIIATLGQITDGGHVLLILKRHVSCIGAMEAFEVQETSWWINKICWAITSEYKAHTILFEHGIRGQAVQHTHLHFLPNPDTTRLCLTNKIREDFPGLKVQACQLLYNLRDRHSINKTPYILWKDVFLCWQIYWNPPVPPAYLRLITAEMLGVPERGDWRKIDPDLDKKLWSETVMRLRPHFYQTPK